MCAWGKVNKISNQGNKNDIVRHVIPFPLDAID